MKRNTEICNICNKEISLSNIQKHKDVCLKNIQIANNNLDHGKGWIKTDPIIRKERAKKAALARNKKFKKDRQIRLHNLPWEELKKSEYRERIDIEQHSKCAICKIDKEWNNKPLKFELDHINGNRQDESRENLRLLCPNCHSQTETYKIGNNKQVGKVQYTDEQIIQALKENTSGYSAIKSLGMNPHGGNYVRIRKIIKKYNLNLDYTV
jgi:5-methylcytosine-specific restriction endonuclease McrA